MASNQSLQALVAFEPVHQLDELSLCLNRGFNEAYTTDHYDEFLNYGDCKPNDSIVRHINELKQALKVPYGYSFASKEQQETIDRLVNRTFVQPNLELKWTDEPYPWTLYLPPIVEEDLKT